MPLEPVLADMTAAIILGAGKGTRMKSDLPKVLHPVAGKPMISRVLNAYAASGIQKSCVVLSPQTEPFADFIQKNPQVTIAIQERQQGTGDAVAAAGSCFQGIQVPGFCQARHFSGKTLTAKYVVIGYGDMPAISPRILTDFVQRSVDVKADIAVIGMRHPQPTGYGRLVMNARNELEGIVEEKDANDAQRQINLCNTGIVFAKIDMLFEFLSQLQPNNAQREYYLTDCFARARAAGKKRFVYETQDYRYFDGVNNPEQLAAMERWLKENNSTLAYEKGM